MDEKKNKQASNKDKKKGQGDSTGDLKNSTAVDNTSKDCNVASGEFQQMDEKKNAKASNKNKNKSQGGKASDSKKGKTADNDTSKDSIARGESQHIPREACIEDKNKEQCAITSDSNTKTDILQDSNLGGGQLPKDEKRTEETSNKDEDQDDTFYAYGFEEDGDGEYFSTDYTYDVTVPPEAYIL